MEGCIRENSYTQNTYGNNGCEDQVSAFLIGYYENATFFKFNKNGQNITHLFGTPCFISTRQDYRLKVTDSNLSPPGTYCAESPSCPTLSLFRI
jgi:hypothetical protein